MIKTLTCIECPNGCSLTIEIDGNRVLNVSGNQCEKGEKYAHSEIEDPVRIITSAVLTQGLALKMIPVKTDKPIPRDKVFQVMEEIGKARIKEPLKINQAVIKNILGLDVNIVTTRGCL